MCDDALPPEVKAFIERYVESIGGLEVLLFIYSHRDRPWTADEIGQELRTCDYGARVYAEYWVTLEMVDTVEGTSPLCFQYRAGGAHEDLLRQVHAVYKNMPHKVINTVYPNKRALAQQLADAFRWRGPKK